MLSTNAGSSKSTGPGGGWPVRVSVSDRGLDAFAQGLGDALVGSGVGVTIVRPGFVVGRMTEGMDPAPFSTDPTAVAAAVVKGIGSGAEVVYAPPILRWVFAVMRQLPRAVWRRMPG